MGVKSEARGDEKYKENSENILHFRNNYIKFITMSNS